MTEDQAAVRVAAKLTGDLTGLKILDSTGRVREITMRSAANPRFWWAERHDAGAILVNATKALEMAGRLQAAVADTGGHD